MKRNNLPFNSLEETQKSILVSIPWISPIKNPTPEHKLVRFETKYLTFWCPKTDVILGKIQFSRVQKEIDKACIKDKSINIMAINRTIGSFAPSL